MKRFSAIAAVVIVGAFMIGLMAAPVNAQTATAPTWQVGESWAMGKEIDLGKNVTDNLVDLKTAVLAMTNLTLDAPKVDSKASAYVLFTVLSETDTTYTVQAKLAIRFATQADVSLSGKMPVAGTYNNEQLFPPASTVETEMKTISVDLTEKMGVVVSATLTVGKDTLAIERMDWNMLAAMKFDVVAKNLPEINRTGSFEQTLAYKNYDIGMDMVARLNMTTEFEPGLSIYQFPFTEGDIWYTSVSMATLTGDVSGFFDAHGLTAEQKEQIFTEDLKNATGATDFPISFDHLNSPNGEITDGKFGPYYGNTTALRMRCLQAATMTFGDAELDVFTIDVGSGANTIYYSPGFRVFGVAPDTSEMPSGADTAMSFLGQDDMMLEPVATAKATAEINSIETYTNNIASEAGSNGIADFFLKAPFIGIILVVAAIISISAVYVILKKARKPLK